MSLKLQYETDKEKIISVRVSKDFQGNKYYNCDVCWTCKRFSVEPSFCIPEFPYVADYPMRHNRIIHPDVYRCSFWEGRK